MTSMNIEAFLKLNSNPDSADDEAFALACDQAEGALRAGVRLSLAEYAGMTAELRAAWIVAGNRVLRDGRGIAEDSPETTIRAEVERTVDELAAKAMRAT